MELGWLFFSLCSNPLTENRRKMLILFFLGRFSAHSTCLLLAEVRVCIFQPAALTTLALSFSRVLYFLRIPKLSLKCGLILSLWWNHTKLFLFSSDCCCCCCWHSAIFHTNLATIRGFIDLKMQRLPCSSRLSNSCHPKKCDEYFRTVNG